jgi:uncharacterized MAPEG superfamily protein
MEEGGMLSASQALAASAVLTWVMIMAAALLRSKMWTPDGLKFAFGNRENALDSTELAGRADRAAKNMLENMVLFTALFAAVKLSGSSPGSSFVESTNIFFFARLAYWIVYLLGIPYVRTAIWAVAVFAMWRIAEKGLMS